MTLEFLWPLFNHLWQSTLFAVIAGLLTLLLRNNRARVRHSVWLAASCKFLIPVSLLVALGSHLPRREAARPVLVNFTIAMETVSEPFPVRTAAAPPKPRPQEPPPGDSLPAVLLGVWACGAAGLAGTWAWRWRRMAASVRSASPLDLGLPITTVLSEGHIEPGVFGIIRPVMVLPSGIVKRLTPKQMQAVIAHELCHVRHRDNFAAAVHMFVETVFWFHPLLWWMGKRMVEERERACDEAVLSMGSQPATYAGALLDVCKFYVESPLSCVSGVTGSNLKKRIEEIMKNRISADLHFAKKSMLVLAGAAALAVPIALGAARSPLPQTDAQAQVAAAKPATASQSASPASTMASAQATPSAAPQTSSARTDRKVESSTSSATSSFSSSSSANAQTMDPSSPAAREREQRKAYADAHYDNPAMRRLYTSFGAPDDVQDRGPDATQVWRYHYLDAFNGGAEFEIARTSAMHINYPPPSAVYQTLEPSAATAGLPGGHASVSAYGSSGIVIVSVPLDSLSGHVEVQNKISSASESRIRTTAMSSDYRTVPAGTNQTIQNQFTLPPGSYSCVVTLKVATTGQTYSETIPFQVN